MKIRGCFVYISKDRDFKDVFIGLVFSDGISSFIDRVALRKFPVPLKESKLLLHLPANIGTEMAHCTICVHVNFQSSFFLFLQCGGVAF
jgi:hypothetical protein